MPDCPNVIHVYADDLGRGMLSCYGQRFFETPNIDRIAAEGIRFQYTYGCTLCAPARASLLTGRHDCHAGAWTITRGDVYTAIDAGEMEYDQLREVINNTGIQAGPDEMFLPQLFKEAGYVTGEVGKLEWGFATTPERLERHGWDYHYGYYDHVRCHGFYPPYLFENGVRVDIPGNTHSDCAKTPGHESPENRARRWDMTGKAVYSQDLFDEKILAFIRKHKDQPFFLFHPSQLPHGPISIPKIHPDVKDHPELTQFEQEYASMVLRLDATVGLILDELDALGIAGNTIVVFSSDNGHELYAHKPGEHGSSRSLADGTPVDNVTTKFYSDIGGDVFDGNDGMAGLKRTAWEGGARVPCAIRWPGHTPPGAISDHILAKYDFFGTFAELLGIDVPPEKDSHSFLPVLTGNVGRQTPHDCIVYASCYQGPALVTGDGWKLLRINQLDTFQLYYLPDDYREENDLATHYPDKVQTLAAKLLDACDGDYLNGYVHTHQIGYPNELLEQRHQRKVKERQQNIKS